MREKLGRYMQVEQLPDKPRQKTHRWWVLNARHGHVLGEVTWSGAWRQYVFDPEYACTFSAECLEDIAGFLKRVNAEHKG